MRRRRGPSAGLLVALIVALLPLGLVSGALGGNAGAAAADLGGQFVNPLPQRTASGAAVENCADPSVLRGRGGYASWWYMYCTTDPLNDRAGSATRLPTLRSRDLVHWTFVNSALPGKPAWAASRATLWAPDVVYSSRYRRYYLTFTVTDVKDAVSGERGCQKDPAIGYAVARTPHGPWTTGSAPLVRPRRLGAGCSFASTIDSDVLGTSISGSSTLYYGGFRGGLLARPVAVTRTGMRVTGTAQQVTAPVRYEAANVVARDGYYYLFTSSGSCCNGPLSGYGVFVSRSRSPYGPFVDRDGTSMTAARTGGTPALSTNGNRWVGPGHNSVFSDFGGQWWTAYHAIDRADPFFAGRPGFTRRPAMLDPVDWVDGWPVVRNGAGPSDGPVPVPAAQSGQRSAYRTGPAPSDVPGAAVASATDEFDSSGDALDARWSWVREPADPASYAVEDGALRIDTHDGGLSGEDRAPVLTQAAPAGAWIAETAVRLDVPASGPQVTQAGLIVHGTDDAYVKLTHTATQGIRVTEFGSKVPPGPEGYPRYGSTTVGPPGDLTWLRIVRRGDRFTALSSRDGSHWVRGGTWVNPDVGPEARIGLVSMGGAGWTARFEHVRVWQVG